MRRCRSAPTRTTSPGIDYVDFGVGIARKGGLGPDDVLNARDLDGLPRVRLEGARLMAAATRPRGRESKVALQARAKEILKRLKKRYPDAHCELDHRNAFELLCATILSAQCTDARVNLVTPELFRRYPDAAALAMARPEDVEAIIRSTGFFRNKTKSLIGMANAVVERHAGHIPDSMEAAAGAAGGRAKDG